MGTSSLHTLAWKIFNKVSIVLKEVIEDVYNLPFIQSAAFNNSFVISRIGRLTHSRSCGADGNSDEQDILFHMHLKVHYCMRSNLATDPVFIQ
jgi:hypothetical protein